MSTNSGNPTEYISTENHRGEPLPQAKQVQTQYTVNDVQKRWATIFGKYASMGYDTISTALSKAWTQLSNPFVQNYRIKQINAPAKKTQQEELQRALANPENSEYNLQTISFYLYYTNYIYNQLIRINRDTPRFDWYVTPQDVSDKDFETEAFKNESKFVDKIMKAFSPNLTCKTLSTQVNIEGKSSYLYRISYNPKKKDVDFFTMQKLNSNMVKLTGFGCEQQFIASFNMVIFLQPGYDVKQYPPFIRDVWEDMLQSDIIQVDKKGNRIVNPRASNLPGNGTFEWDGKYWVYWVQLPQDLCYTFYTDGGHPNAFPDTIGMFNDFNELDDYRWLQASLLSKGINSILTAEVPIIKDPKPGSDATVISPDTILGYTDFFTQNISGNIWPFFAPFDNFELHTLESQPEALDVLYDRTRDLIATSGNSPLLSISDKPSIASVKAAQNLQASRTDYLTRQFENFLNNVINKEFDLKYKWKVSLWGDIFNKADDIKVLKELVLSGVEGVMPKLLSAIGYSVEDYRNSTNYMKALGIKIEKSYELERMEKQTELNIKSAKEGAKLNQNNISSSTSSSSESIVDENGESKNPVGRPRVSDDELSDEGAASRDGGWDEGEIKNQYSTDEVYDSHHCPICGEEVEDGEYICEDCLEQLYDERLRGYKKKGKTS